jgi:hypothetical protein
MLAAISAAIHIHPNDIMELEPDCSRQSGAAKSPSWLGPHTHHPLNEQSGSFSRKGQRTHLLGLVGEGGESMTIKKPGCWNRAVGGISEKPPMVLGGLVGSSSNRADSYCNR